MVNPRYLHAGLTPYENVCLKSAVGDADVPGSRGRPKAALQERLSSSRGRFVSIVRSIVYASGRYSIGCDITFGSAGLTFL